MAMQTDEILRKKVLFMFNRGWGAEGIAADLSINSEQAEAIILRHVLGRVERHLSEDLANLLECSCTLDSDGKPIRSQIDEMAEPGVVDLENLIRVVREALGETKVARATLGEAESGP